MRIVLALILALGCVGPALGARVADPRMLALVDQRGLGFDLADLAGRPTLVTFVASRCTDTCPIANAVFYRLYQRLRREGTQANLLTVTLDPDYDAPFVMAQLARQFDVEPSVWRFASGDAANVRSLMRDFGVTAQPDAHGIPEAHSSFVYVLDSRGRLSRTLLLSTTLVDEAARLLRTKSQPGH